MNYIPSLSETTTITDHRTLNETNRNGFNYLAPPGAWNANGDKALLLKYEKQYIKQEKELQKQRQNIINGIMLGIISIPLLYYAVKYINKTRTRKT